MKITIYRPAELPEERELADGWTLTSPVAQGMLREMLDGAQYEHVTVLHEGEYRDMFVAEDSRRGGLDRNEAATAIYRNNWVSRHPNVDPESLEAIYGPAVLFDVKVWR